MKKFKYTAIDQKGKNKTGTVTADTTEAAQAKISAMGLMPTTVSEKSPKGNRPSKQKIKRFSKTSFKGLNIGKVINHDQLTIFTRQLATLLKAGLPLLRSLEVMIGQERNLRFKDVLEQIAREVRSGTSFSDALAQHPKVFDRLYVNMIRAGEAGGVLDSVLLRLASFLEKALKTRKKVKSAMVYPFVVIFVAITIVTLLMIKVVPKFETMLKGKSLPAMTQVVVSVSNFLSQNLWLFLGIVIVVFLGLRFSLKTKSGSKLLNGFTIHLPKIGDLGRKLNIAQIARTFGTLLSNGVPILQSMMITRDATANVYYADALIRVHDCVRDGESVAASIGREKIFPYMVTSMIDVGEETGQLAQMLHRIADNYDEDIDNAVASITSIIEPIMIVLLAIVVGFIVIALFLPIIEIMNQMGGAV